MVFYSQCGLHSHIRIKALDDIFVCDGVFYGDLSKVGLCMGFSLEIGLEYRVTRYTSRY